MDEQLENKAQEAAESMEQAANQSWQNIEFAANQETPQPTPVQPAQPVQPVQPVQPAPQYYQPPQQAPNDPNRWTGELYTPEVTPPSQPYPHQPSGAWTNNQRAGYTPPPAPEQKDKFPVWAIVLIVLLVLLICIACTVLPFALIANFIAQSGSF